jgi:hypothetical protein
LIYSFINIEILDNNTSEYILNKYLIMWKDWILKCQHVTIMRRCCSILIEQFLVESNKSSMLFLEVKQVFYFIIIIIIISFGYYNMIICLKNRLICATNWLRIICVDNWLVIVCVNSCLMILYVNIWFSFVDDFLDW